MAREEVKIVISAQDRTKTGFGSASRGLKGVNKSARGLLSSIAGPLGLTVGLAALAVGIKSIIKSTADFEQRLSNISTLISGDSTQAINQFREGINELLKVTPKSADELGAAAYQIVSAGISDTAEALEVLKASSRLAVAGLGTTEEATDLLTSALNAFQIDSADAEKTANLLFATVKAGKTTVAELSRAFGQVAPIAAEMGLSLADLQAATAALTTSGLKTSVAQTALKAALSNLLKPTKEMKEAFEKLGVAGGKQLIEQSENIVDVFQKIRDATNGNVEALSKAFGSVEGLSAVLSLTGAQGEAYTKTMNEMTAGTEILSDAVAKQREQYNAQITEMKNKWGIIMRDVGERIIPLIIGGMDILTRALDEASFQWERWTDFLSRNIEVIDKWISRLGSALSIMGKIAGHTVLGRIAKAAGSLVSTAASKLVSFEHGGVVQGAIGKPVPAIVHGGETIIPAGKRAGGITVNINNPVLLDRAMVEKLSQELGLLLRNDLRV